MRAVGLITEYNPFHNGHLYHLQESCRVTAAEVSVAVMSGHFLQRGEPALVDKWVRAEMALAAGVDLVVELPLPWACSSAPDFARGAVQVLTDLGVDSLCFGSEAGEIKPLQACADFLHDNDATVTKKTTELLRQGVNYPQARAQLLADLLPAELDPEALSKPNNILGIEYLKALRQFKSPLSPTTIKRVGAGYHDTEIKPHKIASATGIRQCLASGGEVDGLLPESVFPLLQKALSGRKYFSPDNYFKLLSALIFRNSDSLKGCWLVENGMENRLQSVAEKSFSLEEFLSGLKSRQLTRTRIQRMLIAVLLEMDKSMVQQLFSVGPLYFHLLAVSPKGEEFLASRRKQRTIPLVQNFSRIYPLLKRHYGAESPQYLLAFKQLQLELRATKIYTLLVHEFGGGHRNRDFYEKLQTGVHSEEGVKNG